MSFKRTSNPLSLEKVILRVNNSLVALDKMSSCTLQSVQTNVPVPKKLKYHPWASPRWRGTPCGTLYNLTVVGERVGPAKRHPEDTMTLKSFFQGCEQEFSDKEKEAIFWKVFIGKGGEEAALVAMRLKASVGLFGYDGWALPSGDVVSLNEMRIISFVLSCGDGGVTVFRKLYPDDGGSLSVCMEFDMPLLSEEERRSDENPRVQHSVLGFILPRSGRRFVVDPFSLKFGLRREGYLFWWGDWDDYIEALPGNMEGWMENSCWGSLKANEKDFKKREYVFGEGYQVKYGGPKYLQVAEEAVLASLDKPSCSFCGTLGETLKTCTSCKEARCQKSGWKAHREACRKKT